MALNPLVVWLVVAACVVANGEAASLTKIDCTKCRLDVYSSGSKDYDCGISRHNKLPVCVVECKKEFNMSIPIPNLTLEFDPKTCVPSSASSTTTTPKPSTRPATVAPETTETVTPGPSTSA